MSEGSPLAEVTHEPTIWPSDGLVLTALAMVALVFAGLPPPRRFTPDTIDQLIYAQCLVSWGSSHSLSEILLGQAAHPGQCVGSSHWMPGFPATVALVQGMGLSALSAARFVVLVSGALLPFPLYILGRAAGGRQAGLFAATWVALEPLLRVYSLIPDARVPSLLLSAGVAASFILWQQTRGRRWLCLSGVLGSQLLFFRPEGKLTAALLLFLLLLGMGIPRASHLSLRQLTLSIPLLGASFLVGMIPFSGLELALDGIQRLEPRAWESVLIAWTAYIPKELLLSLVERGAEGTLWRTEFQQALQANPPSGGAIAPLSVYLSQLIRHLPEAGPYLLSILSPRVVPLALAGCLAMARSSRGRWGLALLFAWLSPLLPLLAVVQAYNPQLPESNLLLVPLAFAVPVGVFLARVQQMVHRHASRFLIPATVLGLLLLAGLSRYAFSERLKALELFESGLSVERAAAWLRHDAPRERPLHATYVGNVVAFLGGRAATPWPSHWEIPLRLEEWQRGKEGDCPLLILTSVDLIDRPLEVKAFLRATPRLKLLWHSDEPKLGVWVAIMTCGPRGVEEGSPPTNPAVSSEEIER